jgi:hypothetical protein
LVSISPRRVNLIGHGAEMDDGGHEFDAALSYPGPAAPRKRIASIQTPS